MCIRDRALVECVLCNVPFFQSLAASGDSAAAYNTLGPGLERRDDGLLEVTDPTQAYLQVAADGSSDYVRVVPVSDEVLQGAERQGERVLRTVRVRPDADRRACELTSVSLDSSRSLYVLSLIHICDTRRPIRSRTSNWRCSWHAPRIGIQPEPHVSTRCMSHLTVRTHRSPTIGLSLIHI